jgi:hypothetical protein
LAANDIRATTSLKLLADFSSWLRSPQSSIIDIFPNTQNTWYTAYGLWITTRVLPQTAEKSVIAYDVYTMSGKGSKKQELLIQQLKEKSATVLQQLEVLQADIFSGSLMLDHGETSIELISVEK